MHLRWFLVWLSIGLFGCSTIELDEVNPTGVDLSGVWVLDAANSDLTPDFKEGLGGRQRQRRPNDQIAGQRRDILGATGSDFAFISHDFEVLGAQQLVIEQNHDSMGIAHEPGVYRDVSWGERQRGLWEIYAGWEENDLLILSKAKSMSVQERYRLSSRRLTVEITIQADSAERTLRRVYTRR